MKAASNSNMAGVSAAAAGQEIFVEGKGSTRQRPQGFVVQNRFNYLTAGKKMLQKCSMIGLTADAVSVGQDHILNVFLWNPDKKEAYLGPPQAVCLTCPISTRSEARMKQESCLSVVHVFSCGQDFGRHLGFKPGPRHDGKKHDMQAVSEAFGGRAGGQNRTVHASILGKKRGQNLKKAGALFWAAQNRTVHASVLGRFRKMTSATKGRAGGQNRTVHASLLEKKWLSFFQNLP